MTYEENIIFEQYFQYKNLTSEEGDYYLDILRHIKDICDSDIRVSSEGSSVFDIVFMSIIKESNGKVTFNGAVSNGEENKCVDGLIEKIKNKTYVMTEVYRLHPSLEDEEKIYSTVDYFSFTSNKVNRRSEYVGGNKSSITLKIFDHDSLEEYKLLKARGYEKHVL
ncbi:MAG: hypothetical protein GX758_01445 [Tenericutes bacterium]|nr:hypothetical protein [Mycoplasmatota bacterium]